MPRPIKSPRRGFTLAELLVVIGVLSILMSLLAPSLARTRRQARAIQCMAHIRENSSYVQSYCIDSDELFPSWEADEADYENDRARWRAWTFQDYATMARQPWNDYTDLPIGHPIFHCPAIPRPLRDEFSPEFWYVGYSLTSSVYADPAYFDPALPEADWKSRLGAKVQRFSATTYPAQKVLVYELEVWHDWDRGWHVGMNVDRLFHYDTRGVGSVAYADGHVAVDHPRDGVKAVYRYPIWAYVSYASTPWGMRGRDR